MSAPSMSLVFPEWLPDAARQRIALYLQNRHREALESLEGWEWVLLDRLRPRVRAYTPPGATLAQKTYPGINRETNDA